MNLFISFSGGKTSAYMTKWLLENKRGQYNNIVVLFANTGREYEQTLEFVNRCDKEWDLNVVWLEARVIHGERIGTKYSVVDFETANRDGEVFEEVIKKYGIPNQSYPHCTRDLKLAPMNAYIKDLGWKKGTFHTAIGIRADEMDRVNANFVELGLIYPLCEDNRQSKGTINAWWRKQAFTLELKEHQGNCNFCWKKSKRKLLTLAVDDPGIFDFPMTMEEAHGLKGHNTDGTKRVFFRNHMSTKELLLLSEQPFDPFVEDQGSPTNWFDFEWDSANGCSESCEVY